MKTFRSASIDAMLYLVVYLIAQFAVSGVFMIFYGHNIPIMGHILSLAIINLLIMLIFYLSKWCPCNARYLRERHWSVYFWVLLMPLGLLFPMTALQDLFDLPMDNAQQDIMLAFASNPWGFLVLGFIAPIAEEMVFRGAILRRLMKHAYSSCSVDKDKKRSKTALMIAISALLFGLVHVYPAQILNATIMGLLLGYIYVRTGSILPCIVFHCTNNIIICFVEQLMPGIDNMTMYQLAGSYMRLGLYLFFSLCIFVPAFIQFQQLTKR